MFISNRSRPVLALLVLATSTAAWAQTDPGLAGTWEYKEPVSGFVLRLVLHADGTGTMDDEPIRWSTQAQTLSVVSEGETIRYQFQRQGDALTVSGGDLDAPTVFQRSGGKRGLGGRLKDAEQAPAPPAPSQPQNPLQNPAQNPSSGQPRNPLQNPAQSPVAPQPAVNPIVGTWTDGQGQIRFDANGTCLYLGHAMAYTTSAGTVTLKGPAATVQFQYRVEGDRLHLSMDGQTQTLTRIGAAPQGAPPAQQPAQPVQQHAGKPAGGVVGTWNSEDGPVVLNADGTGSLNGQPFTYTLEPGVIVLSGNGQTVRLPYQLDGDRMTVTVNGQPAVLTRAAAPRPGDLPGAGVYVAQEASVDPGIVMTITQYLILYPDGTVGWAKAEGGATRTQVSQHIERFSSFHHRPDLRGQTYGRWESDGTNVTIRWNIWNNLVCRGRLEGNKLRVEKMGILNEGSALDYERQ